MADRSTKPKVKTLDDLLVDKQVATEETLQQLPGLAIPIHDYISVSYPQTNIEVYTYKTGGGGGATVATVTVIYTDATKDQLSSVAKT